MSEEPARVEGASPARAGEAARELIRRTRQVTHRKFPAEEKIRILLGGIRGEVAVPRGIGQVRDDQGWSAIQDATLQEGWGDEL